MDEIKNLAASPSFWFASVILAFLMSFLAGYAKDLTDRLFIRRTAKKDAEARLRQANFETKVRKVSENPHFLALYQTNIIYQKLRQVLYLIVGYIAVFISFYSALRFEVTPTLGMLAIVIVIWFQVRSVSKRLADLRAVINAVLNDDEIHFVG